MARPTKHRRCKCRFQCNGFKPIGIPMCELERVILGVDELEAMRLCDVNERSQEEAGVSMKVSRGTIQRLLSSGREKVVRALVFGQAIVIESNTISEKGKKE